MLSKLAKISLVSTSIAPIFLTLWFVNFRKNWNWKEGVGYLLLALLLTLLCWILLYLSSIRLEKLKLEITSVKTADNEMIGFILAYLLPLMNKSSVEIESGVMFVVALLFLVIITSNSYHFNPLIGFLGYHFYEVTITGGISYVLISKKSIRNYKSIKNVVHISEYMIMEA